MIRSIRTRKRRVSKKRLKPIVFKLGRRTYRVVDITHESMDAIEEWTADRTGNSCADLCDLLAVFTGAPAEEFEGFDFLVLADRVTFIRERLEDRVRTIRKMTGKRP